MRGRHARMWWYGTSSLLHPPIKQKQNSVKTSFSFFEKTKQKDPPINHSSLPSKKQTSQLVGLLSPYFSIQGLGGTHPNRPTRIHPVRRGAMGTLLPPPTVSLALVLLLAKAPVTSPQQCRSYNRQAGNCVSIQLCPPLLGILQNPSSVQVRQLQRLTCGFQEGDPKVCCPLNEVTPSSREEPSMRMRLNGTLRSHPAFQRLPDIKDCGITFVNERIIGGKNVSLGSYPWMTRVGYKTGPNSKEVDFYCGGTIIGKRWVLTAAHCTDSVEEEYAPVVVRVGEHDTESEEDCDEDLNKCYTAQEYAIHKVLPHRDYSSNTKQNDISLILLKEDIQFHNLSVKPICLPFVKEYALLPFPTKSAKGIVAGWGRTQWNKAQGSRFLQEVTVPLRTNEECQSVYSRRVTISPNQLCAGGVAGEDSCGGDSGGPIMFAAPVNKMARFFQLGVVSYGPVQCGIGGLPGVYARTTSYLKWILDTIAENE